MTTRRQGRFRGDRDPKPIKPPPPLRYRILPVERDFDNLDMLQAELDRERATGKMDEFEHSQMQMVLDKRRGILTARRAGLTGEFVGTDYDAMPFSPDLPLTRLQKLSRMVWDKPFELVLLGGIMFWLAATNGYLHRLTGL